jgi:hypothetical protein
MLPPTPDTIAAGKQEQPQPGSHPDVPWNFGYQVALGMVPLTSSSLRCEPVVRVRFYGAETLLPPAHVAELAPFACMHELTL